MTNVYFYGDANLPGDPSRPDGHFEHSAERPGYPVRVSAARIPPELRMPNDQYIDYKRFLPWVDFDQNDPEQRSAAMTVEPGEGMGRAELTHTANCTVLAMHDRTGDRRGGCHAIFWAEGRLAAHEMRRAIERDFPRIWARINGRIPVVIPGEWTPKEESFDLSIPDELFAAEQAHVETTEPTTASNFRSAAKPSAS